MLDSGGLFLLYIVYFSPVIMFLFVLLAAGRAKGDFRLALLWLAPVLVYVFSRYVMNKQAFFNGSIPFLVALDGLSYILCAYYPVLLVWTIWIIVRRKK